MNAIQLNDNDFFAQYLNCSTAIFSQREAGMSFLKDAQFVYRSVSSSFAALSAHVDFDDVIGKTDYQLNTLKKYPGLGDTLRAQDIKVRDTLKMHYFLHVTTAKHAFIVRKFPIINPSTQNCVGIQGWLAKFLLPHPLKIIYKMNKVSWGLLDEQSTAEKLIYDLTERQHMVLFLYVNRYSNTEIATIMTELGHKLSASRVNDHLENLRYIFAVKTKQQLIDSAISLNYHLYIPRKFLKIGSYDLDDELIISAQ